MSSVRAFFAVELGASARAAAVGAIDALRERAGEEARALRFVRPESLHLTLRFLGDVTVARLGELVAGVAKELAAVPAFAFALGDVMGLPNARRPRVFALEIVPQEATTCVPESLVRAAEAVERGVVAAGFPAEARAFRPHVTLARVKGKGRAPALGDVDVPDHDPCDVRDVVLMQSELRPDGARYTPLERIPLGGSDFTEPISQDTEPVSQGTEPRL